MIKKLLFFLLFVGTIVFGIFAMKLYTQDVDALIYYEPKATTQIYDRYGDLVANVYDKEHRLYARFDEIPPRLVEALIAIEDTAFFEHHGLNYEAIFRATYKVLLAGRAVEGASTITQQLVKNVLLTREKNNYS